MNKDLAYDINFMMTVGCMAHEMIHEYAELHGEAKENAIEQSFMQMRQNSHTKPMFSKKYKDLFNDFGIDAMQSIGNKRREELNA
mgnify:CR=1 FL=1